jgi:hypothetical protein
MPARLIPTTTCALAALVVGAPAARAERGPADPFAALDFGSGTLRASNLRQNDLELAGPLPSLRLGVAPDLTIAVDAWPLLLARAEGGLGLGGALEVERQVAPALRVTGTIAIGAADGVATRIRYVYGAARLERALTRRQSVTATALLGGGALALPLETPMDAYAGLVGSGLIVAGTWAAAATGWLGVELSAGLAPLLAAEADTAGGTATAALPWSVGNRSLGRVALHAHWGRGWRVSLSSFVIGALVGVTLPVLPNLEVAKRW